MPRRSREPRHTVFLRARMQTGAGWVDVVLRNVSARGAMANCSVAPDRGHYVELRYGSFCFVGRVVWSAEGQFGLRLQDEVDLRAFLAGGAPSASAGERRQTPRASARAVVRLEAFDDNRRMSAAIQWVFITVAGVVAAFFIADEVRLRLGAPVAAARHALQEPRPADQ